MPENNPGDTNQPEPVKEPPVPQLADVPEEEWEYSNSQAFAGCGVVGAVVLAIILPILLGLFMNNPWDLIIGFGAPSILGLYCAFIIYKITREKRLERRESGETASHDSGS